MLETANGNLLDADVEALVNAVNTVGVMGKGIALQFKSRFREMFVAYGRACKSGELQAGRMHVFKISETSNPLFIINFPTKRDWREASRMDDIEKGLAALRQEIQMRGIRSVAVPALGCGNGGLNWRRVFPAIQRALGDLEDVRVLVFPPDTR